MILDENGNGVTEGCEIRVWADGTTQLVEDGEPLSYKSDDFIVVDADTTYSELAEWVGEELADDICCEYEIMGSESSQEYGDYEEPLGIGMDGMEY